MKPDGAIPHRARVVRTGRGVRWTGAWTRERSGESLGGGVMWTGANGVKVALSGGERWPGAVEMRVGRRWKRGRPFPRAARSFHQPPQLAGSAAAPPARPELTLFSPIPNRKSSFTRLSHPPKRLLRWMNGTFPLAIHQNGLYGG